MAEEIEVPDLIDNIPVDAAPYWVGVSDLAPRFVFHVGGIAFPRVSEMVSDPPSGSVHPIRNRTMGCVQYLLPHQVELVHKQAYDLVVRMIGTGPKSRRIVLNSQSTEWSKQLEKKVSTYRADRTDHPVACYIFILPAAEKAKYCAGAKFHKMPPTMEAVPAAILDRLKLVKKRKKTADEEHAELIEQAEQYTATRAQLAASAVREK